jgi:hypothetical protein
VPLHQMQGAQSREKRDPALAGDFLRSHHNSGGKGGDRSFQGLARGEIDMFAKATAKNGGNGNGKIRNPSIG